MYVRMYVCMHVCIPAIPDGVVRGGGENTQAITSVVST